MRDLSPVLCNYAVRTKYILREVDYLIDPEDRTSAQGGKKD